MDILDGKRHDKVAQAHHLRRAVYLLNGGKHWGWLSFPGEADTFTPEVLKRADAMFLSSFRALANQWIDSGVDAEIESPLARNIRKVPPGYTESLFDVLYAWLNRNMPKPTLMNSGKIAIVAQSPNNWTADEHGLARQVEPAAYARECAIFHFKELLDTPGAHRLARCNNPECGRLYLRSRLRKREIKRGTFCADCAGKGSQVRTRATRDRRRQALIELAAGYWAQWKTRSRREKQSVWVALKVNRDRKSREDMRVITDRWVSRNREAIEREIEKRTHRKFDERPGLVGSESHSRVQLGRDCFASRGK
jgi:hypothetical protein